MKELLNKLGITDAGYFSSDGSYIIDFENADQFNVANSKLDKSDLVKELTDTSVITGMISNIVYLNDDFMLNLIGNFDTDEYKLVVSELY